MSIALIVFRPACLAILSALIASFRINSPARWTNLSTASAPIEEPVASNAIRFTAALGKNSGAML